MGTDKRSALNIFLLRIFFLFLLTVISAVIGLAIGSVWICPCEIISSLFNPNSNSTVYQIIYQVRLPRVLLALFAGGGLALTGAVFQSLLLNPLADPYILGISSGGTFGAMLSMLLGFSIFGTSVLSFSISFLVVLLVFIFGKRDGELEPNSLLLSGVMIGAFFSALILLVMTILNDSLRNAVFLLIGNVSSANYSNLILIVPFCILALIYFTINAYKFNILSLGSETAKTLGLNPTVFKNICYIVASLVISSIVSVTGIIGFVGLIIPHISRLIFGTDNRIVVPSSFFIGASFLIICDTIARVVFSPAEIPTGGVTAILGAPFFIYLLKRKY